MRTSSLWILLPAVVGCAVNTPPAQRADEAQDYEFRVGTRWTYTVKWKGEKQGTMTLRVTKIDKGVTYLSADYRNGAEKTPASLNELRWIGDGGLYFATEEKDGLDAQLLYKLGSKKGDRW